MPAAYADRFARTARSSSPAAAATPTPNAPSAPRSPGSPPPKSATAAGTPSATAPGRSGTSLGQNRGGAGAKADTGISGLALLAFLGAGHTHREGPYADNVARGLDYLRRTQGANGNLGGDAELFAHMYCHSMATFAVSEAYALTGDERLDADRPRGGRLLARRAASRPTAAGGTAPATRATPASSAGSSWRSRAPSSAGVDVPDVTWTRVDRFLRSVERGAAGGLAAYRPEEARPRGR